MASRFIIEHDDDRPDDEVRLINESHDEVGVVIAILAEALRQELVQIREAGAPTDPNEAALLLYALGAVQKKLAEVGFRHRATAALAFLETVELETAARAEAEGVEPSDEPAAY